MGATLHQHTVIFHLQPCNALLEETNILKRELHTSLPILVTVTLIDNNIDSKGTHGLSQANTRISTASLSPNKEEKSDFSGNILSAMP